MGAPHTRRPSPRRQCTPIFPTPLCSLPPRPFQGTKTHVHSTHLQAATQIHHIARHTLYKDDGIHKTTGTPHPASNQPTHTHTQICLTYTLHGDAFATDPCAHHTQTHETPCHTHCTKTHTWRTSDTGPKDASTTDTHITQPTHVTMHTHTHIQYLSRRPPDMSSRATFTTDTHITRTYTYKLKLSHTHTHAHTICLHGDPQTFTLNIY